MDVVSGFQSLLRNLKNDDGPWTLPKTWESIAAESGIVTPNDPVHVPQNTIYDPSYISEVFLVRLVINALQGVRSAIFEIDKLSLLFCSSPADRSFNRVPSLWCRLSSTHALGRMLNSISHSGLMFFFLREFVSYFLCTKGKGNSVRRDKNENCPLPSACGQDKSELKEFPPYSLVNQAFAVAVGKLLEGYICALNTLSSSIKLRRLVQRKGDSMPINYIDGTLTSVVNSEMTFMEVYLHSKELRSHIEALGSICFCQSYCRTLISDVLSLNSAMEFNKFPRGANLLSYLYVQFRDADPLHHCLLKYLFVHSYEPYSSFIKMWMYRATIDDPYGEFFVASSDPTSTVDIGSRSLDNFYLASMKSGVPVPCFLKGFCHPLLLAGQQLQVFVKMLDCCGLSFSVECIACDLSVLKEILPFWVDSSSNLDFLSNPLCFDIKGMQVLIQKREIMYSTMLENLQKYLSKFSVKDRRPPQNAIPFGSVLTFFGGSHTSVSVFDDESNFIRGRINEAYCDADSDASSSSTESAFETEISLSSELSTQNYISGSAAESLYDLQGSLCQPSKSTFLKFSVDHAEEFVLPSFADCQFSHPPFHTSIYPITSFSHDYHQIRKMNQIPYSSKSNSFKDIRTLKTSSEICQPDGCWPLGGLQSNPFLAYMKCRSSQQLPIVESCFEDDEGNSDKFSSEDISFSDAFGPLIGSRRMKKSGSFITLPCYLSTISLPYDFSMNPMFTKTLLLPTVCNSRDSSFINDKASHFPNFNFSSVTDSCKLHSESLPLGSGYRCRAEASMSVQLGCSAGGREHSGRSVEEKVDNQPISASLCYSAGKEDFERSAQLPNASGGADWTSSLKYRAKSTTYDDRVIHSEENFLVPLDVILDRCILQEILLQYKYISCFTIKLLEEGFNLREHLMALRRYFFIEISDWADLFVMSLRYQTAFVHNREPARIQRLLDLALRRSSCENDPYKERLFIYTKESTATQSAVAHGLQAFDFMVLGYQVDWPVNFVLTQGALKIYADIFSFLLQIRLAVCSLTDVWHYLKDLFQFLKHDPHRTLRGMEDFNVLMRIRQHISHFATTLQQYMQSQLSGVSWHRFQDSLEHMVKYMLDLESVHMLYLTEAVRLCFLTDDAKEVAKVIRNILQCALDFRLCFAGIDFNGHLYRKDKSFLRPQINFTQVSIVQNTFKKNLKELQLLYLKCPNHSEFSLHRFWSNLNYNDYYSTIINNELFHTYV